MTAYYNEHDSKAAAWLRELIKAGHIAPGDVDERSIEDVVPAELFGYTQCHFFAGIGVWSHALRRAGWDDDKPVWTGSCPCQPFSAAGKRAGLTDERHLWPAFDYLIGQCRPDVVFSEQVASSDGLAWLDIVQSDLEAKGYAIGTLDLCAAGFGAPHIRQRLYFVADAKCGATERHGHAMGDSSGDMQGAAWQQWIRADVRNGFATGFMADAANGRLPLRAGAESGRWQSRTTVDGLGAPSILGDTIGAESQGYGRPVNLDDAEGREGARRHVATAGFWSDAEWLYCRDGKYRPTQPGVSPLAYRAAARMGRLRGYGNAIVAPVAEAFIRAYMEVSA